MKNWKNRIIALWLLSLCYIPAIAQTSIIRIINSDGFPVEGAVVILKPLQDQASSKQQVYLSNNNGEAIVSLSQTSSIFIHSFGYGDLKDTIDQASYHTFHLARAEVNLNEVIVTGQYDINTSDQSVYNVKVIDPRTIQQMGAQNLTDVLSNQLSTRLSRDNILGSSAEINGIAGQNIKILIDGVPVIGRENGNIDLSQINLNNVERIEVIEGPMSVSYGTDALGGLINIVTKKTSSFPLEANIRTYYESSGTYNGDGILFLKHKAHSLSLSGGRYFFDGYSAADTARYQEWKPKLQFFGAFNYNYASQLLNVGLKTEYYNEEIQNKGTPVLTPYQAYAFDDYYLTQRINQSLFAEYRLQNNAKLQLTNAYNVYKRIKNTYRKDLVTLNEELSSGSGTQDSTLFDEWTFRGTYSSVLPERKMNFQLGYDINLQSAEGESLGDAIHRLNDYAVFGSFEYEPFNNLYLRPGLRFAYNSRYGAPLTPSLNLKYDIDSQYTLRASYARGFRSPSLKELDLDFVDVNHNIHGNDSLKAESSDNFNASFSVLQKFGDIKLTAEAAFFYNDINNIITLALINPAIQYYTYININQYKTRGGSFSAELRIQDFTFSTGLALLALYNSLADTFPIEKFSLTPEFRNNFMITFPEAGIEGALFFKSTGSTPGFNTDEEGNVFQTFLEPYNIMDASVTKHLWNNRITMTAGVKNIFNVTSLQSTELGSTFHSPNNTEVPYAIGRFVFASMQLKFFKK